MVYWSWDFGSDVAIKVKVFWVFMDVLLVLIACLLLILLISDIRNLVNIKRGNLTIKIDKPVDVKTPNDSMVYNTKLFYIEDEKGD